MAFAKTFLLAVVCLFSISGFVQESDASEVAVRSGRALKDLLLHSEISDAEPDDGNEGNEGDEGNEGTFEGDEGGDSGGSAQTFTSTGNGGGDQGGDQGGNGGGDQGGDQGGNGGGDQGGEEDGGDEPDMPAPEEDDAEEAPEEEDDGTGATATAVAVGGGAAAGAGAAAATTGEGEGEEEDVMPVEAPASVADSPAAARQFMFPGAEAPADCMTLRHGLMGNSDILAALLPQVAPEGDGSELSTAIDNPESSVTVLLPTEVVLASLGPLVQGGTLSVEQVQSVLLDHVIPMAFESAELADMDGAPLENFNGGMLELDVMGDSIMFTLDNITATVTEADLNGCSETDDGQSVIHRIDALLTDTSVLPADAPGAALPGTEGGDRGDVEIPEDGEDDSSAPVVSLVAPAFSTAVAAAFMLL